VIGSQRVFDMKLIQRTCYCIYTNTVSMDMEVNTWLHGGNNKEGMATWLDKESAWGAGSIRTSLGYLLAMRSGKHKGSSGRPKEQ
jgi:hypothetical protein